MVSKALELLRDLSPLHLSRPSRLFPQPACPTSTGLFSCHPTPFARCPARPVPDRSSFPDPAPSRLSLHTSSVWRSNSSLGPLNCCRGPKHKWICVPSRREERKLSWHSQGVPRPRKSQAGLPQQNMPPLAHGPHLPKCKLPKPSDPRQSHR